MSDERIFLGTWYILALLNARDACHSAARALLPRIQAASRVITTEAVLVEVCNGLARYNRDGAVVFVRACHADPRFEVIAVNSAVFESALQRAVFVIGGDGRIAHAEYVADQLREPDYAAALAAIERLTVAASAS